MSSQVASALAIMEVDINSLFQTLPPLEQETVKDFFKHSLGVAKEHGVDNMATWSFDLMIEQSGIPKVLLSKEGILSQSLWISFLCIMKCFVTSNYPFKYPTLYDFLLEYLGKFGVCTATSENPNEPVIPNASNVVRMPNYIDVEINRLYQFANWINVLFAMIPAKKNKGLAMHVIPKVVEGVRARYVTGSGQTVATADRVYIYEHEGNIKPYQRGKLNKKKNGEPPVVKKNPSTPRGAGRKTKAHKGELYTESKDYIYFDSKNGSDPNVRTSYADFEQENMSPADIEKQEALAKEAASGPIVGSNSTVDIFNLWAAAGDCSSEIIEQTLNTLKQNRQILEQDNRIKKRRKTSGEGTEVGGGMHRNLSGEDFVDCLNLLKNSSNGSLSSLDRDNNNHNMLRKDRIHHSEDDEDEDVDIEANNEVGPSQNGSGLGMSRSLNSTSSSVLSSTNSMLALLERAISDDSMNKWTAEARHQQLLDAHYKRTALKQSVKRSSKESSPVVMSPNSMSSPRAFYTTNSISSNSKEEKDQQPLLVPLASRNVMNDHALGPPLVLPSLPAKFLSGYKQANDGSSVNANGVVTTDSNGNDMYGNNHSNPISRVSSLGSTCSSDVIPLGRNYSWGGIPGDKNSDDSSTNSVSTARVDESSVADTISRNEIETPTIVVNTDEEDKYELAGLNIDADTNSNPNTTTESIIESSTVCTYNTMASATGIGITHSCNTHRVASHNNVHNSDTNMKIEREQSQDSLTLGDDSTSDELSFHARVAPNLIAFPTVKSNSSPINGLGLQQYNNNTAYSLKYNQNQPLTHIADGVASANSDSVDDLKSLINNT